MPTYPGKHGICFVSFNVWDNGSPIREDINFFTRLDINQWLYTGVYNVKRFGQFDRAQMRRLPPKTVDSWTRGVCTKRWGQQCIDEANAALPEDRRIVRNERSVNQALQDGRLKLSFTVMQCVGYRTELFDALMAEDERGLASNVKGKNKTKASGSKKRARFSSEDSRDAAARKRTRTAGGSKTAGSQNEDPYSGDSNSLVGSGHRTGGSSSTANRNQPSQSCLRRSTRVRKQAPVADSDWLTVKESDLTDIDE
jgi:hypothetical protein